MHRRMSGGFFWSSGLAGANGSDCPIVHYTSPRSIVSFCSIHFSVVQPSKGYSAVRRFAYQTCSTATDRFGRIDYRHYADYRVGGGVLLPMGAPAEFAEWENFYEIAAFRETRRDGQEGRILDFALPRAVPRELLLPLAAFALLPFVEGGMAVRLDVECVPASDGEENPHAHSWLAQRVLEQDGFGLKQRSWNALFRRNGGRYVRALVAARLTLGCAILGVEAHVDPRRNEVRGGGIPEARLPRRAFCTHNDGSHVEALEQKASRPLRRKAQRQAAEPEVATMTVTNAAESRVGNEDAAKLRKRFADAAEELGHELEIVLDAPSGLPAASLRGTSVVFDGRAVAIAATGNSEDAAIVARLVRRLDWPALVVEGDGRLADLMAIAAADEGVFMVNRAPSLGARDIIARAFLGELKSAIARHDPLGVAAEFLADFAAKAACPSIGEAAEETIVRADAVLDGDFASAADSARLNIVPVQPSELAEAVSALSPLAATSDSDARSLAARSDARQTADSSSEAIDDFDSLPDDDSWKTRPDPGMLMQYARELQADDESQRQRLDEIDELLRRMPDRRPGRAARTSVISCARGSGRRTRSSEAPELNQSKGVPNQVWAELSVRGDDQDEARSHPA